VLTRYGGRSYVLICALYSVLEQRSEISVFSPSGDWMSLSALPSTTARYEKAGFAKLVDAGATMGANLALAR
jgi:hypothetical protein